ncbi:MAG: D-2-hydroxyacid dehydrogenase family protein [Rhodospirillales bacterium]|nr:D-2-hydroxyacid dehydrogenase family protein [Rhodospirillales bacterium]MBO6786304.1 D-2-hydroxyacid dehydrogenase family protein [Rhodospirillales bacterium]
MALKLAILDDYQNAALGSADWSVLGDTEITVFDKHLGWDEDVIAEALQPFDVLVCMRERTRFPASQINKLPNLKCLVTTGMRNLAIDMAHAKEKGIVVAGTDMLPYPAAEHAVALITDLYKKISKESRVMRDGGWQAYVSESLNGRTLGVLGLGKLGARVAKFGLAMEMDVIAWSQNLTEERCNEVGVRLVDRDTLFETSDVISIHLILSERTTGLVGEKELKQMKPTSYLVNTSRGPIVDEGALVNALSSGEIAGAGVDVYEVEPLPADHPLRSLENAVLTGHTGYVVKELYELVYAQAVDNVKAWMDGTPTRVLNDK